MYVHRVVKWSRWGQLWVCVIVGVVGPSCGCVFQDAEVKLHNNALTYTNSQDEVLVYIHSIPRPPAKQQDHKLKAL